MGRKFLFNLLNQRRKSTWIHPTSPTSTGYLLCRKRKELSISPSSLSLSSCHCVHQRIQESSYSTTITTSSPLNPSLLPKTEETDCSRYPTPFVIFDTAKNSRCPLTLKRPNVLSWYSCGPTVYDSAHIGHASSYIRQDVIRRILQHFIKDLTIVQVMGITDIDDKIINRANHLDTDYKSISRKYEKEFQQDLSKLGVIPPQIFTRVSDFIPQILEFVGNLVKSGLAYPVDDGSVYFDSLKYGDRYGIFRQAQGDDNDDGVEEELSQKGKKSSKDFALWKGSKPGEPYWDSPWGLEKKGRPGWHIECSVMATEIFGPSLDLHTGGKDLIFPHHENEEAQCCAHFQLPKWSAHWLHMGHLHFKGANEKMSKSLGNTISIGSFLEHNPPHILRLMCIVSRYRKDLEYSDDTIEYAKMIWNKFQTFFNDCSAILQGQKLVNCSVPDGELWVKLGLAKNNLNSAWVNDFDTPEALKIVTGLISDFHRHFDHQPGSDIKNNSNMASFELVLAIKLFVQEFLNIVGLAEEKQLGQSESSNAGLTEVEMKGLLDKLVEFRNVVRSYSLAINEEDKKLRKEKIAERKELLEACDTVRKELLEDNFVEIKDHGKKSSWSYVKK